MSNDNWNFTTDPIPETVRAPRAQRSSKWGRLVEQLREEPYGTKADIKVTSPSAGSSLKGKFKKDQVPGLDPAEIENLELVHLEDGSHVYLQLTEAAHNKGA